MHKQLARTLASAALLAAAAAPPAFAQAGNPAAANSNPSTVCGAPIPQPAALPPANSGPVVYLIVPCFARSESKRRERKTADGIDYENLLVYLDGLFGTAEFHQHIAAKLQSIRIANVDGQCMVHICECALQVSRVHFDEGSKAQERRRVEALIADSSNLLLGEF